MFKWIRRQIKYRRDLRQHSRKLNDPRRCDCEYGKERCKGPGGFIYVYDIRGPGVASINWPRALMCREWRKKIYADTQRMKRNIKR